MRIKQYYYYFLISRFLLFSCTEVKQGDLPVIPVDIVNNIVRQLPLSEIAESITAIELELTDESVIDPRRIKRIILSDDFLFIAQSTHILVFTRSGEFVRSIGSKGQGPGEYISIENMAIDEINRRLFVNSDTKIICYDWNGKVLLESFFSPQYKFRSKMIYDINYINNELFLISWSMDKEDENGTFSHAEVYRLNDYLQIIDSCSILKFYGYPGYQFSNAKDYILASNSMVYIYYPFSTAISSNLAEKVKKEKSILRDTLFRFENNQLVPEFKLKFKNDGIDFDGYMFINLINVYRSSRYIFAKYVNYSQGIYENDRYHFYEFCYDTKTGKGYRILVNKYTDDINHIEGVDIRPFHTNPETFYYWYTNMKPDDREEPNPTLYIGTLKK